MIRVLPRDAFNDASLLKCIGKLALMIEDGKLNLEYVYDGKPFDIQQDWADGSTYVANFELYTASTIEGGHSFTGRSIGHRRGLNSRLNWPLVLYIGDDEYFAFNEKGDWLPSWGRFK